MKKIILLLCALLLLSGVSMAEGNAYDLPLDINFPNYAADPAGFSENAYHDDSLDVHIENGEYRGVKYFAAYFTVKSPTQLRTATAGRPNEKVAALPSHMSRQVNAVLAMNGEFYIQRTRNIFVYRQGVEYRNQPDPVKDVLIIDDKGDFHIFRSEEKEAEIKAYMEAGGTIVNAFSFGPGLVIDGEKVRLKDDYYFNPHKYTARAAVAQVGPLSYAFIFSPAATQKDMGDIAALLNVQQAYNMDGGNSAVVLFNNEYIGGKRANTEREQSDILYVVSAVAPD